MQVLCHSAIEAKSPALGRALFAPDLRLSGVSRILVWKSRGSFAGSGGLLDVRLRPTMDCLLFVGSEGVFWNADERD